MRFAIVALLGSTLGGCIIYEKDVYRHHDEQGWSEPDPGPDEPDQQPGGNGNGGGTPSEGEGEGEGDTGNGGEGEGEGETGQPDTGGEGEGEGETGGEGEGEGEEEVVWTFWPDEIAPGQTLLTSLTTYPASDYFEVLDVALYGDLEVCDFVITSTEIYVSVAASPDAVEGPVDALVVMSDGGTTWVTDAITVVGEPILDDTGATTGCE